MVAPFAPSGFLKAQPGFTSSYVVDHIRAEARWLPGARYQIAGRSQSAVPHQQKFRRQVSSDLAGLALLPDETVIDGEVVTIVKGVVGYVQLWRKRAYLIGVGVSELHINHIPGVARQRQERPLYVPVSRTMFLTRRYFVV